MQLLSKFSRDRKGKESIVLWLRAVAAHNMLRSDSHFQAAAEYVFAEGGDLW